MIIEPFEVMAFDHISQDAILYVPEGTKEKYQQTEGWDEFKEIVEME